jgi:hypothetical protein
MDKAFAPPFIGGRKLMSSLELSMLKLVLQEKLERKEISRRKWEKNYQKGLKSPRKVRDSLGT